MKIEISNNYISQRAFIESVPLLIERGEGEMLYHGRNEVWRLKHKGLVFVVKHFKRVNEEQQVIYTFFRPTKAARAYRITKEFRLRGINTPREIAFIEMEERGLFTIGYFISEEARGSEVSRDLFKGGTLNKPLAKAVIQQIVSMHNKGVLHGDLNLANILYERRQDGTFSFNFIDVNCSFFTDGWPIDEQCLRNIVRMTHNLKLYEYLVRYYAELRGWNSNTTFERAVYLLHQFENRRLT